MIPLNQISTPSDEWYEVKGRLFRFFGTHPGWARWQSAEEPGTWLCGRDKDRDRPMARDTRIAALQHDPRLLPSRSLPEQHAYANVTAAGWARLLQGIFTYLGGPARLDDVATLAAVELKLPGAARLHTGAPDAIADASAHLTCEQMDAAVEGALPASVNAHVLECASCARQLESYRAGAALVSTPLPPPVRSMTDEEQNRL